jgi:glycosyltransferase involved in cell wall biosynthesis
MKIFRIIARLNVGGPARHVVWLTKGLQNNEFQSLLVTGTVPQGEEDMGYFAEENGVKPFFIQQMSRELSPKDIISLWKIFAEIWREKPDIIHTHTAKAGTIGRIAGFLYRWISWRKVKIVHTFHGHVFHSYYGKRKTQIFLLIEKVLARFATDKIITISEQQFNEIHEQFGVGKRDQFEVIPLGIDLDKFANSSKKRHLLRDEIGVKEGEILVGLVGRLTEIKNHSLFLKIVNLCQQDSETSKLKFAIIGDGHLRKSLEDKAKNLGVKDKIAFVGHINDVDIVYAGLDIVALTSLNEGTPLSLIEAMASGKCVISTEVGGVVDLLGKVENVESNFKVLERGILVGSNNAKAFSKGLSYLAKNEKLQRQFGKNGLEFVIRNYSKERLLKDISRLYREIAR